MTHPGRTRWSWAGVAWVLLPVAAWLVGTLWLGGEIGKSTDDYSINMRDPATGELPSPFNPWQRYPFFWRPLHIAMCFGAGTLLSEHWRVPAVFCAVVHGAACLAVFALLRAGTRSRGPAAIGALVILLHPMNFEVTFWFSSISAAIATALWCGLALWCTRLVARERGPRAGELVGVAALALTIPCFYEQPATGVLALPLILLAAWLHAPTGPRLIPAFIRAIVLCGTAGAMNVVYIVLLRLTAPGTFRGGSGSFVSGDRVIVRIGEVARSVRWQLYGNRLRDTTVGAWETGLDTLATPVGIAAVVALAVLVIVWSWAWAVEPSKADERPPIRARRAHAALARCCWIGAGLMLFLGSFVPIALMVRQNVEPRTLYFPLVGLCIILAQVVDLLLAVLPVGGRAAAPARIARAAIALTAGAAVIAGTVCAVGIQTWCNRRGTRDDAIARRLAELVPNPPPSAAYLPMRLDSGPTATGRPVFDRLRPAAFAATWSATAIMQQSLHRADVAAACVNPWADFPYDRFSEEGLWFCTRLNSLAVDPRGKGEFIPWGLAIPFVVDDDGRVRLVREIEVTRADERVETFIVPVVRAAIRAGDARGQATAISLTDSADPPARVVSGWEWFDPAVRTPAGTIAMQQLNSRGTKRDGVWLHPTYQNASRAAMQATIEPAGGDRTLRFRITTPPEDYVRFAAGGAAPVTVHIELFAGPDAVAPIAETMLKLTRELAESQPRWPPLSLVVPASDSPLLLRIRVTGTAAKGATHAPLWITPGMWVDSGTPPQ